MLEQRFDPCTADPGLRTPPAPVVLSITSGKGRLDPPVRPPRRDDDPLSARAEVKRSYEMGREDWRVRIESATAMTASATDFHLTARLEATEGGEPFFTRDWDTRIPRDGV